jgi:hypothetical protein
MIDWDSERRPAAVAICNALIRLAAGGAARAVGASRGLERLNINAYYLPKNLSNGSHQPIVWYRA